MKQKHAGDRLEAGVVKGHPFGISLNQLHEWFVGLVQPSIGLAQIGLGKIHSHECGLWQYGSDLVQRPARSGGHIKNTQASLWTVCKSIQA